MDSPMKNLLFIVIIFFVLNDTKSDQLSIYCDLKRHIKFDYTEQGQKINKIISLKRKFLVDSEKKMFITSDFLPYLKIKEVTNFEYLDSQIYRKVERKNNKKQRILLD
ncbi:MAG: hypothetical protein CMM99_02470 [Rickettsiales bacterium]|nr:hypothetical protein [Rickettsiales bacterium]